MSSLQPRPAHRLLRCPLCKAGFTAAAGALVCRNRHSFDLAREGYVNLLPSGRHRAVAGGGGSAQLRHRAEFLDEGHFDAIAATIVEHIEPSARERRSPSLSSRATARAVVGLPWRTKLLVIGSTYRVRQVRRLLAASVNPVEPCAMGISPGDRSAVHGEKEAAPRPLLAGTPSNSRQDPGCLVRDPIVAQRADRLRKLLPFWG